MKAIRVIVGLLLSLLIFVFVTGAGRYARHYVPIRAGQLAHKVSAQFGTIADHGKQLWEKKVMEVEELLNGTGL